MITSESFEALELSTDQISISGGSTRCKIKTSERFFFIFGGDSKTDKQVPEVDQIPIPILVNA